MAVTAYGSGTQTAVITTEHTLASIDEAGVYTLHLDLNAMATGDVLEIRAYQKVLTGGTARPVQFFIIYGAQPTNDKIAVSMPLSNELAESGALSYSIKQTRGTGRAYPWKVLKHG